MTEGPAPFFSVCIPQYRRVPFLVLALESLRAQTMKDFEVCVSDDVSPANESRELQDYLASSGLVFRYRMQKVNRRYDGNLRSALHLARGRYCFLLANDDGLIARTTLGELRERIERTAFPEVVISNFRDAVTGLPSSRVPKDTVLDGGHGTAVWAYHRTSFVSGIALDRAAVRRARTRRVDGSEMYQMYLVARIVAAGGRVLATTQITVEKDLQIPGQTVDSYARKTWTGLKAPLARYPETASYALRPGPWGEVPLDSRVILRFLALTVPFWILEYRRIFGARAGRDVLLGLAPGRLAARLRTTPAQRIWTRIVHGILGGLAYALPTAALRLGPRVWAFTKRLS